MATEQALMQQANKLLNQFTLLHREKYGTAPKMNRFKEKYAMKDVIESVGFERAQVLVSYYFKTARTSHPVDWFKYNFDRLDEMVDELADDAEKKKKMREQTRMRVEQWKAKQRNES